MNIFSLYLDSLVDILDNFRKIGNPFNGDSKEI